MAPRTMHSPYMHWAKKRSGARYNLATSGVLSFPLSGLPMKIEDLELTRAGDYGYAPLREAIARHCGVDRENVVSALGTSMANHLAMAAIVEPGDDVVVEHPTYELLLSTLGYLQANIRRFSRRPETGFKVDPSAVEQAVTSRTKLIVLTNLHNPSSTLTSQDTLREVGRIAKRVKAHVLVDEAYLEAIFDDPPEPAFRLGDEFIVTNSLTKVYGLSGLRCGWILAQHDLARRISMLDDLFSVNPPHPAERLSCVALEHLGLARAQARGLLDANRPIVNEFLASRADLNVRPLEYGTVVFPRLLSAPVDRLCELLRNKYEITVVPGSFFEMPDHFRIGIGGETGQLREGLQRLGAALDEVG